MKIRSVSIALGLAALALITSVAGIFVGFYFKNEAPILVSASQDAQDSAQELLGAIADGDYEKASGMILGEPDLGIDRPAEDAVGVVLWDAYQDSLEFTPVGKCFATDAGLAQRYTVRYLDVGSVVGSLRERATDLLEERVAQAENVSDVYDENNEYRKDVVDAVLSDAATQALAEGGVYIQMEFTLNLVYRDGAWWAIPDSDFLKAISGGLAG